MAPRITPPSCYFLLLLAVMVDFAIATVGIQETHRNEGWNLRS
jgi:hypothetical protein